MLYHLNYNHQPQDLGILSFPNNEIQKILLKISFHTVLELYSWKFHLFETGFLRVSLAVLDLTLSVLLLKDGFAGTEHGFTATKHDKKVSSFFTCIDTIWCHFLTLENESSNKEFHFILFLVLRICEFSWVSVERVTLLPDIKMLSLADLSL